ncbi:iron complex transport system ATP-binding protein [Neorhizobium huautlense]|uniref:Iron complex transport system ATP-binding protein n=1 Tax=Neorhizobium huautlense TaxID=67774 RepID=A0ABT9PPZ6_9HYPH|nr:ATP-binding cassette domain-containing protein [Neorhizobium huautlense]MDP9836546.1 iron complex transport system ATP-binding protein [Neorhizobium huautlense]
MIRIEQVSLQYGAAEILKNVSLTIPKGGVTALIGPNGAGKSSLLSLISRLQSLQAGSITIDDLPVDTTPSREMAKKIAILRQDNQVGSRLTVKELVGFGRFPHNRGHVTQADADMVGEALKLFDLTDLAGRFLETLSGGQRQRALVAMAFCQDTDYLLLDEPLNNLDMYFSRELMRLLRWIADERGKTIVTVLHDINYGGGFSDRIIAMKHGQVVADGPPRELVTTETLRLIYGFDIPVTLIDGQPVALPFTK